MYDVIVVGAGPAGSTCAEACAASGLSTLLLEKDKMPRDKPCGGMTSSSMMDIVDGLEKVVSWRATHVKSYVDFRFAESHPNDLLMFERPLLDEFLARRAAAAGAEFREGVKVTGIDGTGGSKVSKCAIVKTPLENFEGKIVVDAAGINSHFFREYKKVRSPRLLGLVLEDDLPNDVRDEFFGNQIGIGGEKGSGNIYYKTYVFARTVGYGWAFGKDGKINVGMGGVTGQGKLYAGLFDRMLDSFPFELDRSRRKASLLPTEVIPRLCAHRLLFVGDAAGFVDPMTGGGIELGIKTAKDAAAACRLALDNNDFSGGGLSVYEQLAGNEIRMLRRKTLVLGVVMKAVRSPLATRGAMRFCLKHFSRFADTSLRKRQGEEA